jgi:hypothetical protein
MALFDTIRAGASGASDGYQIEKSLMLNDQDQTDFRRTPSSNGNRRTMTFSFWAKHVDAGNTENSSDDHYFYNANFGSNNPQSYMAWKNNRLAVEFVTGGSYAGSIATEAHFRDTSAWSHYVVQIDTTQSTDSNRVRIYINGDEETNKTGNNVSLSYPSQNFETSFCSTAEQVMFEYFGGGGSHNYDGYVAEFHLVDGSVIAPTEFAEYDNNNNWIPKAYTGSYGTTGFYLKFTDNSDTTATTMGKDYSGNGNNWTPSNFNVSDISPDTPTNNFCVMNINDKSDSTNLKIQYGGRKVFASHGFRTVRGTFGVTSGKWYWEARLISWSDSFIGVTNVEEYIGGTTRGGETSNSAMIRQNNGDIRSGGSNSSYGNSQSNGDVLGFALDMDNGKFYISENGTFYNSGDPANGTNPAKTGLTLRMCPAAAPYDNKSCYYNFGADDTFDGNETSQGNTDANGLGKFKYAPPSGFLALCSKNLPDPTIAEGAKHFDITTYTANNSTKTISGFDFSPDWVWVKNVSRANRHAIFDVVRGATKRMRTDGNESEVADADTLTSFNSDGFSIGADSGQFGVNDDMSSTFAAFCWSAGDSTVTNTTGSISAQVRANATAGFSIVTYSGNGSSGATVGHGLGVTPACIIIKCRSNNDNWMVYHHAGNQRSSSEDFYLELNESAQRVDDSRMMNDTAPTSSVFSLRNDGSTNSSGRTYVAYCFAEVEGYSAFGGYTGNSSTNGTFINTGFRPAWVLVKKFNGGENWQMRNTFMEPFNVTADKVEPNLNGGGGGNTNGDRLDILSNGFKGRDGAGQFNDGHNYIYLAFAEHPFKTARGR